MNKTQPTASPKSAVFLKNHKCLKYVAQWCMQTKLAISFVIKCPRIACTQTCVVARPHAYDYNSINHACDMRLMLRRTTVNSNWLIVARTFSHNMVSLDKCKLKTVHNWIKILLITLFISINHQGRVIKKTKCMMEDSVYM